MKAMILAAGKGTRVRPLTYDLPKPMIPILGKPVMAYLVEFLASYGVHDIMVNVSYLHQKIEEYFGDGTQFGVQIGYSFEGYTDESGQVIPVPLGSAGGIKKIQEFANFFDDTTIVICGDALIDLDLTSALLEHKQKGAMVSVITKEVPWDKVDNYGVVVTDPQGRIKSFQEKPTQEDALSNFASTGIYIFEPAAIELIPVDRPFDIGSDLFPLLVEKGLPFYAQQRFFNWIDIGTVTDYWSVLQSVLSGEVAQLEVPGTQVVDGVWVGLNTRIDWHGATIQGPVYIGAGCLIESGCTIIGPTWIGHGSHICSGAEVVRSVLFEYTRILPDAYLEEMVVRKEFSVNRAGEMSRSAAATKHAWCDARHQLQEKKFLPDEKVLLEKGGNITTTESTLSAVSLIDNRVSNV
ncbi:sugar phosphate nucleotidyltransferase [Glaciimonas immobilis]|uniref:Mannose-1-phosphate guanylyltransferase n=1 Tax=Glaciimonas immobilis TaxID=728004 RepID=A0A840RNF4_9BURK|nr:NDP-sugar synthase [Glaciimonas immobilis]KAF3998023.1 NDP-sugar synthase [Glaciimonas immobilis]MBB5199293.1 mannose-1-phosphate guanylyltransferase [Glaciimonas immobilis]